MHSETNHTTALITWRDEVSTVIKLTSIYVTTKTWMYERIQEQPLIDKSVNIF